ncbi:MAG: hypothetical protein BHW02_03500 [Clostridium sp. 28_12]|nr:MAG: hypothetical protein BHW02_03500 [Clostridium sp. 28_12]
MRFNVVNYLIGEGIRNLFKNKKSTMSALMIMCATMLIFGLFFVIGENLNAFVENVADAQEIRVILDNDATDSEIEEVGKEILEIDGVRNAEFVSKDEALDYMKDMLGDEVLDGYSERNIFSTAYNVTLTDLKMNNEVQANIKQIPHVKKIVSSNQVISQIISLAKGVRIVTAGILGLLIIISVSIISNTIKLTVHARRKEISIMKYVGATNSFIRWPFLVEGVIIGIISGLLSVAIIGGAYTGIANQLANTSFLQMANWKLLNFSDMFNLILVVYLGLGIGIGILGSTISMRKYLQV